MAKQGEIEYMRHLSEELVEHAVHKPYSDLHCGCYMMQIGCIMSLLPPVPARLLDVGCGTGWTSVLFAKRGYDVVGVDIAEDMIFHANANKYREEVDNLEFQVGDYETMPFEAEFNCAVFYDSLHHAVDEEEALRAVYRALKPGGVCVTSEPGTGHENKPEALEAVRHFNVTERDMPPRRILAAARKVGFRNFMIYPHPLDVHLVNYFPPVGATFLGKLSRRLISLRKLWMMLRTWRILFGLQHHGLVWMRK